LNAPTVKVHLTCDQLNAPLRDPRLLPRIAGDAEKAPPSQLDRMARQSTRSGSGNRDAAEILDPSGAAIPRVEEILLG
jgi:hypothetical protein